MRNPYVHLVLTMIWVLVLSLVHHKGSDLALSVNIGVLGGYMVGALLESIDFTV